MNTLTVTAVSAFTDNYIWLIHSPRDRRRVVVVDPGEVHAVKQALVSRELQVAGILATHHHADHVGGVAWLAEHYGVPVYGPAAEMIPGKPIAVAEGAVARFDELGLEFAVLDVPGHTSGHIAYVGHGAVFCGDTLFSAGCGRLFEGTAAQLWSSLDKLAKLPSDTKVYCGHEYTLANLQFAQAVEPDNLAIAAHVTQCRELRATGRPTLPSSVGLELNINPFLRVRHETVKRSAEHHAGHALNSEPEVFAVLREWKNNFRG